MATTITSTQAQTELTRRAHKSAAVRTKGRTQAIADGTFTLSKTELKAIAGKPAKVKTQVRKAVKSEVKQAEVQTIKVSRQAIKARKAFDKALKVDGLSAAYKAYARVMQA